DDALEAWGMPMGPFRVLDLVGNDVPARGRREQQNTDPAWDLANRVADEGWLGRKTGAGWYRDEAGGESVPNPDVLALLAENNSVPSHAEIVERCLGALINEAARTVSDGTAARPEDIDTVLVRGYGFPATAGGPWWYHANIRGWQRTVAA